VTRHLCLLLATIALASPAVAQDGSPFEPGCTPTFGSSDTHPIDADCGIEGAGDTDAKKLESRAKNNYCATGTPALVTFLSFTKLQQATEAAGFELGDDRSGAQGVHTTTEGATIGEGSVVTFSAFVIRADTANKKGGELVNCNKGGDARNDLHIHLAPTTSKSKANFCRAVGAEMSPHLRPEDWTGGNLTLPQVPMRFTGQLFYDTSHRKPICPAAAKDKASARASAWEIHPVYRVDVCKNTTISGCNPMDDSKWIPFKTWLDDQEEEDEGG
jgi:hypothetical protein